MSVQEIELAIQQLPQNEVAQLTAWLVEYHSARWERQIESDLDSGKLSHFLNEVEAEYQSGPIGAHGEYVPVLNC